MPDFEWIDPHCGAKRGAFSNSSLCSSQRLAMRNEIRRLRAALLKIQVYAEIDVDKPGTFGVIADTAREALL